MALVVFLRGANVGGHQVFQPAAFAKKMAEFAVVNIGAAGTFVVKKAVSAAAFRAELARRLPFETEIMICPGSDPRARGERALLGPPCRQRRAGARHHPGKEAKDPSEAPDPPAGGEGLAGRILPDRRAVCAQLLVAAGSHQTADLSERRRREGPRDSRHDEELERDSDGLQDPEYLNK